MGKNIYLWLALGWTAMIAILCLAGSGDVPGVKMYQADKFVHFAFYFAFTIFWFKYFMARMPQIKFSALLLRMLLFASAYGIAIEVFQMLFTTTRHADVDDVLANISGAVVAAMVLALAFRRNAK
ncbi:MAG TPA: VanZ family protein [Flavobacterium sp.]